jgi:arylsulfatase A-like enzyme
MADPTKPNILFIMGDDIGWFNISAYNMGIMGSRTPNIDRIGKEGAMCAASFTVSDVMDTITTATPNRN